MPGLYRAAESMEVWKQSTAPTLFINAGKSALGKAIPPNETAGRHACFRDHRIERIEQAGHMLNFDAPEETAKLIASFFTD